MASTATWCCLVLFAILLTESWGCTVPTKVQGDWEVLDVTRTFVEKNVTITSTGIDSVTFWDKTCSYSCYIQQGDYYIFKSTQTDLFDQYDVHIYFCWYLVQYSADVYRMYELTNQVLYTIEERAKAYLNTSSPSVGDVCEIAVDTSLGAYKQMQVLTSSVSFNP